jgi:putative oxidoreductase
MTNLARLQSEWEPRVLSIVRILVGLLYLQHGLAKMFDFPHTANHVPYNVASLVPGVAGILETFGGVLLALGLFTRPVAFLLCGEMAVAYFTAHAPRGFYPMLNGGTAAILYCFLFLYFFVAGGGCWSLDRLISRDWQRGYGGVAQRN